MKQKYPIDTLWFRQQLKSKNKTAAGLGRYLGLHKSAVSKLLSGQRDMTASEQDQVADYLGVGIAQIAAHRGVVQTGFGERKQENYETSATAPEPEMKMFTEADIIFKDGKRWMQGPDGLIPLHPIFGCMKGTLTTAPGVDLTEPMDFEWGGELYNE